MFLSEDSSKTLCFDIVIAFISKTVTFESYKNTKKKNFNSKYLRIYQNSLDNIKETSIDNLRKNLDTLI